MSRADIVNTEDVRDLCNKDVIFQRITDMYGLPPNWQRPPGFQSLVKIILEQQVSLSSARAHYLKLEDYVKHVVPEQLNALTDEQYRFCQVSRQKAGYLRGLSEFLIQGKIILDAPGQPEYRQLVTQLSQVKGIGPWTIAIYSMFCLQEKDIFPKGDVAINSTMKELTGYHQMHEPEERIISWKPLRTLASFMLWHYYLCKRNRKADY